MARTKQTSRKTTGGLPRALKEANSSTAVDDTASTDDGHFSSHNDGASADGELMELSDYLTVNIRLHY
jgi:hypothetical protein